jgi:hypothetical protein
MSVLPSFWFDHVHSSGSQEYEEVIVPPAKPVPVKSTERLVSVSELDDLAKGCFPVPLHSDYPKKDVSNFFVRVIHR